MSRQDTINKKSSPMRNPICVALDVDDRDQALRLADDLADIVGGFKLGPRLCLRYGQSFIREVVARGPVFVDCKFFDIPSTMVASVKACREAGASLVTVHATAGAEGLKALADLENEINAVGVHQGATPFRILAVSILTSWQESSLPSSFKPQNLNQHVIDLAQDVVRSGLKGLVCSAHELKDLQFLMESKNLYAVTPGIRLSLGETHDQKRVMGPKEALDEGASLLVVGRPILEAKNPKLAATDFVLSAYEN